MSDLVKYSRDDDTIAMKYIYFPLLVGSVLVWLGFSQRVRVCAIELAVSSYMWAHTAWPLSLKLFESSLVH